MASKLLVGFSVFGCLIQLTFCAEQPQATTDVLQERQGGGYGAPPPSYGPQSSWSQSSPTYGQALPPAQISNYAQPGPSPPPPPPPTTYDQPPEPSPPPVFQPPPPPQTSAQPLPPPPPTSAYGGSLIAGAGPAPVPDFYAPPPSDSPSMTQLFGPLSDGGPLTAGYGKPDQDTVLHGDVQVLPPVEETKDGETRYYNHVYPEIVKNNEIVSNKEINTYTVQKHRVNVNNRNIHQYVKNIRVNTDYITNIKRINHPHQQVQVLTYVHNRYVPKLYVKHTRNDILNELPPQEVPTVETQQSVQVLPPIIEPPVAQKIDYSGQVIQTLGGNGGAGGSSAPPLYRSGLDAGSSSSSGDSGSSSIPSSAAPPTTSSAYSAFTNGQQQQQQQQQQPQQQGSSGNSAEASAFAPNARINTANWPQAQQALSYKRQLVADLQQRQTAQQQFVPSPQLLSTQTSITPTPQASSSPATAIPTYRSSLLTADVQQLKSYS